MHLIIGVLVQILRRINDDNTRIIKSNLAGIINCNDARICPAADKNIAAARYNFLFEV